MKKVPCSDKAKDVKITIHHLYGSSREVADRARTTIGLNPGDKEVTDAYMRKMYLSRHSPIRTQVYKIKFYNIPYYVGMHLARHKHGVEHFFSTQREDRTGINRSERKQTDTVLYEMVLNSEAILNISNVRLCNCADSMTVSIWRKAIEALKEINEPLASCCVPKCIREGWCYEYKSCGYHTKPKYNELLQEYRRGINDKRDLERY